jgi:hypothetical protein
MLPSNVCSMKTMSACLCLEAFVRMRAISRFTQCCREARASVVVEALCYKPEGRVFNSR